MTKKKVVEPAVEIVEEKPAVVEDVMEAVMEEKCRYCSGCEGVVETTLGLPYYGRIVTVCALGFNPSSRCRPFDVLCMEAQYVKKESDQTVVKAA